MDRVMITSPETPMINMRYFSSYIPRYGFTFSVERLHKVNQKMAHIVVTSIAPPASLYMAAPRKT